MPLDQSSLCVFPSQDPLIVGICVSFPCQLSIEKGQNVEGPKGMLTFSHQVVLLVTRFGILHCDI